MRKVLPVLLFSVCATASADWVRIGEKTHLTVEKYIDNETVRQTGPMAIMRRVWELDHYLMGDIDNAKSAKILAEYDCKDRRRRILAQSWFSGHWATGESVIPAGQPDTVSHTEHPWTAIDPGTISEAIIGELCPNDSDGG